jgi:hypothetical protein
VIQIEKFPHNLAVSGGEFLDHHTRSGLLLILRHCGENCYTGARRLDPKGGILSMVLRPRAAI